MISGEPADEPQRDDEDHDLLTYGEAGVRLVEEIALEEARLAHLIADDAEPAQREAAQARVTALREAAARYRRLATTDTGARGFLDYDPKVSRLGDQAREGQ